MWGILSHSPSESAGMIGFGKAGEGGETMPCFGKGSDLTGGRWSPSWGRPYSEAFLQVLGLFCILNWASAMICGSRFP